MACGEEGTVQEGARRRFNAMNDCDKSGVVSASQVNVTKEGKETMRDVRLVSREMTEGERVNLGLRL